MLGVSLEEKVDQLSSLTCLCRSFLPTLAKVEHLDIDGEGPLIPLDWSESVRRSDWLKLLRLFTGAKHLYLSKDIAPCISPVLRQVAGERMTDVLPALQNLCPSLYEFQQQWPVGEDFEYFVAARQLGYTRILYGL